MARMRSKKRRLLGFLKPSNSMSGLASSPRWSETRPGDFASVPQALSAASPGMLARAKRFFYRSGQGSSTPIATEIADTGTSGRTHEQREPPEAALSQYGAVASTSFGAQKRQEQAQSAPTNDAEKSIAKPDPELTPASAGKDVDTAVKDFDDLCPISRTAQGAVDAVGIANTTFPEILYLSDTYLKTFQSFQSSRFHSCQFPPIRTGCARNLNLCL
ncbi:hypothetical protein F5J12DRAFT_436433 [Pisolithus orientalis]|uniref:uncharacterized protein n=1 Tax=Pisolithus orientalis TaxID=936130 RepID=UPI0022241C16|nr:uncharacterized protein F5J12DRAFT_436433 [Pisolithus orientalis]KAI5992598.1 hypothetical protein F5J12DRAFT_436433 [Pisolithus orientalis]